MKLIWTLSQSSLWKIEESDIGDTNQPTICFKKILWCLEHHTCDLPAMSDTIVAALSGSPPKWVLF